MVSIRGNKSNNTVENIAIPFALIQLNISSYYYKCSEYLVLLCAAGNQLVLVFM